LGIGDWGFGVWGVGGWGGAPPPNTPPTNPKPQKKINIFFFLKYLILYKYFIHLI